MHLIPANAKDAAHYHFDIRFLSHSHEDDKFHKKKLPKKLSHKMEEMLEKEHGATEKDWDD